MFAQTCSSCHQLEGTGVPLGPDLRSVVDHPVEKLFSAILDPSADIQPGYAAYFCELKSREQLYGSIAAETGGSLTFRLADGSMRAVDCQNCEHPEWGERPGRRRRMDVKTKKRRGFRTRRLCL